jgi:hypothetical protein
MLVGSWVLTKPYRAVFQGLCCSAKECSCRGQLVSVARDMGLFVLWGLRQLLLLKECKHVVGDCCMNVCNRLVHRTLSPYSQQIAGTGADF